MSAAEDAAGAGAAVGAAAGAAAVTADRARRDEEDAAAVVTVLAALAAAASAEPGMTCPAAAGSRWGAPILRGGPAGALPAAGPGAWWASGQAR